MKILESKVYRHKQKTFVSIKYELEPQDPSCEWSVKNVEDVKEHQARLNRNLEWMGKHLTAWADFDQAYTLDLFCDSLRHLGKGLLRWDNCVHSVRNGRRALFAAHLIDKAYNYESHLDKSYKSWSKRCPSRWVRLKSPKGCSQMVHDYPYTNAMGMDKEAYSHKMWKVIHDRQEKIERDMQDSAWKYLQQHIRSMWD